MKNVYNCVYGRFLSYKLDDLKKLVYEVKYC